jgi:hypothetical protein
LPWQARRTGRRVPRRALIVVAVIVVFAVGAVTAMAVVRGGPAAVSTEAATGARVLGPSDLPAGWMRVPPVSAITDPRTLCLIGTGSAGPSPHVIPAFASVGYRAPNGTPALVEQLESYPTTAEASARWTELIDATLHGCPASAKSAPALSASPASILMSPVRGDQSATLSLLAGDRTTEVVFIGRQGKDVVMLQLQQEQTAVDQSFTERMISQVMGKISRGSGS